MLILSPLLFAFYLLTVGILYSFLQMFHVVVGYNFTELMMLANPGSGLDLLQFLRNSYIAGSIYKLIFIGLIVAVIFYYLT